MDEGRGPKDAGCGMQFSSIVLRPSAAGAVVHRASAVGAVVHRALPLEHRNLGVESGLHREEPHIADLGVG
jgi:hypothetical protein